MGESSELKIFTQTDVEKMVKEGNRAIVIFEGEVFDTTDFKITHPGGPKYIDDNIGKDITQLFYDNDHSKIALRLIKETKIGVYQDKLNTNGTKAKVNGKERMKEIEDEKWREIIDPAEGTIYQVMTKLSHDEYMNFVNDPKHLTKPGDIHWMFKTPFLEFFSRTPWYYISKISKYTTWYIYNFDVSYSLLLDSSSIIQNMARIESS